STVRAKVRPWLSDVETGIAESRALAAEARSTTYTVPSASTATSASPPPWPVATERPKVAPPSVEVHSTADDSNDATYTRAGETLASTTTEGSLASTAGATETCAYVGGAPAAKRGRARRARTAASAIVLRGIGPATAGRPISVRGRAWSDHANGLSGVRP